jgi:hypothetical protein
MEYEIHDNGGRPFRVKIEGNIATILINETNKEIKKYETEKIFIGKSPKTNGIGYDKYFDGNSILLYLGDKKYIYVGEMIYSFESIDIINKYVSFVGNSDVPYPYAIDKSKNVYLMIEDVIIINGKDKIENGNYGEYSYYAHYYKKSKNVAIFHDIKSFYIGKNIYNLTFSIEPEKDYDRFLNFDDDEVDEYGIYFIKKDGKKEKLTKKKYVKIMGEFASENSFKLLNKKIIKKRL